MEVAPIRQHPERAVPGQTSEFLLHGTVAHVAFVDGGRPMVIPTLYHFDPERPDRLYLHGGPGSRLIKLLATGVPVCVCVTMVDAKVYSRSAKYHSMNYRSVVCSGTARLIEDNGVKERVFERMIARYFPGRTAGADYLPASAPELTGTALLELRIEQISAKQRTGGPGGPLDDDPAAPGTCGIVPVSNPDS